MVHFVEFLLFMELQNQVYHI